MLAPEKGGGPVKRALRVERERQDTCRHRICVRAEGISSRLTLEQIRKEFQRRVSA